MVAHMSETVERLLVDSGETTGLAQELEALEYQSRLYALNLAFEAARERGAVWAVQEFVRRTRRFLTDALQTARELADGVPDRDERASTRLLIHAARTEHALWHAQLRQAVHRGEPVDECLRESRPACCVQRIVCRRERETPARAALLFAIHEVDRRFHQLAGAVALQSTTPENSDLRRNLAGLDRCAVELADLLNRLGRES
jgi:hypothetical protein